MPEPDDTAGFFAGWRGLGRFWIIVGAAVAVLGAALQWLGPPAPPPRPVAARGQSTPTEPSPVAPPPARPTSAPAPPSAPPDQPGRGTPGPVADPDPALLEPSPLVANAQVPRISTDGRRSSQVYAAGFDRDSRRARAGLIVAGIGLHEADSLAAARTLPSGVTFAVSPYAANPARLLSVIRITGHEYLAELPMEPTEFPLSDPGPQALMTSLTPDQNRARLHWALSRAPGFVGATNVLGAMRGERFSAMSDQFGPVLRELAERGLVFVDARAGAQAGPGWGRSVDLVVDEVATAEQIEQRLDALTRLARDRGAALGLATAPRPVTVARIAAWANGLANAGVILAPVTAIANPPAARNDAR